MRVVVSLADLPSAERERFARELAPLVAQHLPQIATSTTRLLTSAEVARRLGLSRKALEMRLTRARHRGEQHELEAMAIVIDGSRRWRERDITDWIGAQLSPPRRRS